MTANHRRPLTNQRKDRFMAKANLTAARLRELLEYDSATGAFHWKVNRGQKARIGSVAGWTDPFGHVHIHVDGRRFLAHRLAWLHVHGEWPKLNIDHKFGGFQRH